MPNYWALAANPNNYRIEDAVKELDQDTWVTKGSKISKGDRVIIWKTKSGSKNRGIISLGEIISQVMIGDDTNNSYWLNSKMANENSPRVLVRYINATNLPLWVEDEAGELLLDLSVAKSQGGTVFKITPEQWDLIMKAIGGWPETNFRECSYWWVNHKQTYRSEVMGGYIWSPKHNQDGSYNQTYENLKHTKPGDIVFSYANAKISAIGVVDSGCMDQSKPVEFGKAGDTWSKDGWMVKIKWHHIDNPIIPKKHIDEIAPLLPEKYSPIQSNGNGNQSCYLASISNE